VANKKASRTRAKTRSDDVEPMTATTLIAGELRLRRLRSRALKKQFDYAHQLALSSLKRRDYDGLHAAIVHEQRIIEELRVLIEEAKMQARKGEQDYETGVAARRQLKRLDRLHRAGERPSDLRKIPAKLNRSLTETDLKRVKRGSKTRKKGRN